MNSEDTGQSGGVAVDPITSLTHHIFDMKLSIESYAKPIDIDCKNCSYFEFFNLIYATYS